MKEIEQVTGGWSWRGAIFGGAAGGAVGGVAGAGVGLGIGFIGGGLFGKDEHQMRGASGSW